MGEAVLGRTFFMVATIDEGVTGDSAAVATESTGDPLFNATVMLAVADGAVTAASPPNPVAISLFEPMLLLLLLLLLLPGLVVTIKFS